VNALIPEFPIVFCPDQSTAQIEQIRKPGSGLTFHTLFLIQGEFRDSRA
jgi:hypothetical protein